MFSHWRNDPLPVLPCEATQSQSSSHEARVPLHNGQPLPTGAFKGLAGLLARLRPQAHLRAPAFVKFYWAPAMLVHWHTPGATFVERQ